MNLLGYEEKGSDYEVYVEIGGHHYIALVDISEFEDYVGRTTDEVWTTDSRGEPYIKEVDISFDQWKNKHWYLFESKLISFIMENNVELKQLQE